MIPIRPRDLAVAVIAAALTSGAFLLADDLPTLHSLLVRLDQVPAEKSDSGTVQSLFKGRTPTLDQLDVHVTTLNPNHAPHQPHKHPNEELLVVKQGTIEALIGGEWKRAAAGDVIFLASNELHGVRNAGDTPAVYHVIGWRTPATPAQ